MNAPRPTIRRLWDGSVRLTFPYAADLVEGLKAGIPAYARSYDPDTRAWTVATAYAPIARQLMASTFPDVLEEGAAPPPPRDTAPPADAWQVLHLRDTAPPELVTAAHRCLAKLHHPDRGGDTATMQAINGALERIREARS